MENRKHAGCPHIMLMEKVVRIFKSFDEADAADSLARSRISPQERVDIFFAIRERAYPDAVNQEFARVRLVTTSRSSPPFLPNYTSVNSIK